MQINYNLHLQQSHNGKWRVCSEGRQIQCGPTGKLLGVTLVGRGGPPLAAAHQPFVCIVYLVSVCLTFLPPFFKPSRVSVNILVVYVSNPADCMEHKNRAESLKKYHLFACAWFYCYCPSSISFSAPPHPPGFRMKLLMQKLCSCKGFDPWSCCNTLDMV